MPVVARRILMMSSPVASNSSDRILNKGSYFIPQLSLDKCRVPVEMREEVSGRVREFEEGEVGEAAAEHGAVPDTAQQLLPAGGRGFRGGRGGGWTEVVKVQVMIENVVSPGSSSYTYCMTSFSSLAVNLPSSWDPICCSSLL